MEEQLAAVNVVQDQVDFVWGLERELQGAHNRLAGSAKIDYCVHFELSQNNAFARPASTA
jgi:hypothetical protein